MNNKNEESTSVAPVGIATPQFTSEAEGSRTDSETRLVLSASVAGRRAALRALREPRGDSPLPDRLNIRTAAHSGPAGLVRTIEYHSAQFGAVLGGSLIALRQVATDIAGNYAGIAELEARKSRRLRETEPYIDVSGPGLPWSWSARACVAFLLVFSLAMIGVGLNTIAVVLQNSGLRGFESPTRAFLFSLVTIGVAVGLKFLPRFFPSDRARRNYGIAVWLTGVVLGGVWACLFSRTFPGMTQSASEILANAMSGSETSSDPSSGWWLILCGLLAEAFIAAGCWLTIETVANRYTCKRRLANQAHQQVLNDLKCLARAKHEVGYYLGAIRGRIEEIEQSRLALLAQVAELFGLALTACEHQRVAIELFQQ
jgi:hypothetical protein